MKRAVVTIEEGTPGAPRALRKPEQAPRGRAAADADDLRPRDAPRGRVLLRHREPSRHIDGRAPGEARTLLDYFPDDWLCVIDESHVTVPQIHGMYGGQDPEGDARRVRIPPAERARQPPAALRRVREEGQPDRVHVGDARAVRAADVSRVAEQIVRPTGLVDPEVQVRPTRGRPDRGDPQAGRAGQRVLVTSLTKKMAEDLTDYLLEMGIRVRYLHSEVDTIQRIEIIQDLRLGEFDVLVGINLLREGLDLPEVVAILDADKEGFLRSDTSLIQTIGRAARNVDGTVIMYADEVTDSMKQAIGRRSAVARSRSPTTVSTTSIRNRSARRSRTSCSRWRSTAGRPSPRSAAQARARRCRPSSSV